MTPRSCRNPLRSARHNDPDELGDSEQTLQTMTMFCMDLFLQAQASRPEPTGHQERPQEVQGSF